MKLGVLFVAAVAIGQETLGPRGKNDSQEKGPRQCGRVQLADNPKAGGLQIECKPRNGKAKNPERTKRCKSKLTTDSGHLWELRS